MINTPTKIVGTGILLVLVYFLVVGGFSHQPLKAPKYDHVTDEKHEVSKMALDAMIGDADRVEITYPNGKFNSGYNLSKPSGSRLIEIRNIYLDELTRCEKLMNKSNLSDDGTITHELQWTMANSDYLTAKAILLLLSENSIYFSKSLISEMVSDDNYYIHNRLLRGGFLYVPIDLSRFSALAGARVKYEAVAQFANIDKGYKWNSLTWDERKAIVEDAEVKTTDWLSVKDEFTTLRKKLGSHTEDEHTRFNLLKNKRELMAAASRKKTVRNVDPRTYLWVPQ